MKITIESNQGFTVTIEAPSKYVEQMVKATKKLLRMRKLWVTAQMSFEDEK